MNDQSSQESRHGGARIALILVVLIIMCTIAFVMVRSFWGGPEPEAVLPTRPVDLPVEEIEVANLEEVADIMDGKPLPVELPDIVLPPKHDSDHIYGRADTEISIIEYSNFGNKYASLLHPALKKYVDAHGEDAHWIYRHYPVDNAHFLPAQAAECAYFEKGHNGFWSYFDASFSLQKPTLEALTSVAISLDMNTPAFKTCIEKSFTRDIVLRSAKEGRLDAQVTVVPSYLIVNNTTGTLRLVEGINTIEYLEAVIDSIR